VNLFLGRDEKTRKDFVLDVCVEGPFTIDADLATEIAVAEAPTRADLGELAKIESVFNSGGPAPTAAHHPNVPMSGRCPTRTSGTCDWTWPNFSSSTPRD
jgi:hypothetical protein